MLVVKRPHTVARWMRLRPVCIVHLPQVPSTILRQVRGMAGHPHPAYTAHLPRVRHPADGPPRLLQLMMVQRTTEGA